ncbi:unnamed protein product, partial [Porites lobata]
DNVLIVIGGDSYYRDENEEARSVISRWARRKVASQGSKFEYTPPRPLPKPIEPKAPQP